MGRELQKKKNKSGIAKVRQKPKSKRNPVLANAVIAANWDKKQTLSQNYRRLGLATRLNGFSGGVDMKAPTANGTSPDETGSLDVRHSRLPTEFANKEAKIERDPSTGAILRILDPDMDGVARPPANPNRKPLDDPLASFDNPDDDSMPTFASQHHISGLVGQPANGTEPHSEFLKKLETDATRPGAKKARKQSQREQEWCQKLFETYGHDWNAMFKDSKLNIMQQSAGELKRRIMQWLKDAGPKETQIVDD